MIIYISLTATLLFLGHALSSGTLEQWKSQLLLLAFFLSLSIEIYIYLYVHVYTASERAVALSFMESHFKV